MAKSMKNLAEGVLKRILEGSRKKKVSKSPPPNPQIIP